MNDEQIAWLKQIASIATAAVEANTVKDYEEAVAAIEKQMETCPEP